MQAAWAENRCEPRIVCQGRVRLLEEGAGGQAIEARLLDVSTHGFRAEHNHPALTPGTHFRFEHLFFAGNARVVWTQVLAGRKQSGFQVVRA